MLRVVSGREMAEFDKHTINDLKVPSLVLMERAALSCVDVITDKFGTYAKIAVLCGPGNNGADGVAIARILKSKNYNNIACVIIGDETKYTAELKTQIEIATNFGVEITGYSEEAIELIAAADLIVDAIFGIGLSRDPAGDFARAIIAANGAQAKVLAVDIPSGICARTGKGFVPHICADETVTFQYVKKGQLLSEGYPCSGNLTVSDIGIKASPDNADEFTDSLCCVLDDSDIEHMLPPTYINDNKGSRGKVLVIAGSETIYGASFLASKAALKTGCGMVRVYTHRNNIQALQCSLPEALLSSYDEFDGGCEEELAGYMKWADAVVIGPGLSMNESAVRLTEFVLKNAKCPVVIDADAINIIAKKPEMLCAKSEIDDLGASCDASKSTGIGTRASSDGAGCTGKMILTPHLMEMSRLCGKSVKEIEDSMEEVSSEFCKKYGVSMILKNFTSYIYTDEICYINTTGNEGMATAGSGDVLAGITASLLAQGTLENDAPALAAFIHGRAGERASQAEGIRQMSAVDIIEHIKF